MMDKSDCNPPSRPKSPPSDAQGPGVPTPAVPDQGWLLRGLSNLGPAATGHGCVYRKLSLPGSRIKDTSFLGRFKHIEVLELPGNLITDATPIGCLSYLYSLDLSNNRLNSLSLSGVPVNLQELDLSRNQIMSIGDLRNHTYLRIVCLDRNLLKTLDGIQGCRYITHLSVVNNALHTLTGIEDLPLRYLDVRRNRLRHITETARLPTLEELYLSHNEVDDLTELSPLCKHLWLLHADHNMLTRSTDVLHLMTFPALWSLRVRGNPVAKEKHTRLRVLFHLPGLGVLDGLATGFKEKVAAINTFDPPQAVVDAVAHAKALEHEAGLYAPLLTPDWGPKVVPFSGSDMGLGGGMAAVPQHEGEHYGPDDDKDGSDDALQIETQATPPRRHQSPQTPRRPTTQKSLYFNSAGLGGAPCPFQALVLCGPTGVGKRTMTAKLVHEYPQVFGVCINHTTRAPRPGERHGIDYYFVSRETMDDLIRNNQLLTVVFLFGQVYGTSIEACERVRNEGKIGILDVELEGAVALYKGNFAARYIYIAPPSIDELQHRLQTRQRDRNAAQARGGGGARPGTPPDRTMRHLTARRSPLPGISAAARVDSVPFLAIPASPGAGPGATPANSADASAAVAGDGSNLRASMQPQEVQFWMDRARTQLSSAGTAASDPAAMAESAMALSEGAPNTAAAGSAPGSRPGSRSGLPQLPGKSDGSRAASPGVAKPASVPPTLPIPFECVIVNDDMDGCYMQLRKVAMQEFWEHYNAQLQSERMLLDSVGPAVS